MDLNCKRDGHTVRAELMGELDQHNAASLREALEKLLADGSVTRIEYDMRGVTFMDSSGIGALLGRYRTLAARGGSMDILNASRSMERILRMSGVYKLCTKEDKAK